MLGMSAQTALPLLPVEGNVSYGSPMGYSRLFLTVLEIVDNSAQTAPSRFTAHVSETGITVPDVLRIDTGGERWVSNPT